MDPVTLRVAASSFIARQDQCLSVSQSKRGIRERIEYRNCSFRPTLNPNSEKLVAVRRVAETQSAMTERLAVKEPTERVNRRAKLADEFCVQPGVPMIDANSAALATTRRILQPAQSVHDRLYSARSVSRSTLLGKENIAEFSNTPKHRPRSANPLYAHVKGRYDLSDPQGLVVQLQQSQKEREMKAQRSREEAARREIEECTFQPNCSKTPPPMRKPVSVSGFDRFLETKRIAREMTLQKKNLDDSYVSFRSDSGATCSSSRLLTVPSPFKFTHT